MKLFPFRLFSRREPRAPAGKPDTSAPPPAPPEAGTPAPAPPLEEIIPLPDFAMQAVPWRQPPMAAYALGTGSYGKALHPGLAAAFQHAAPGTFLLLGITKEAVIPQTREHADVLSRADLRRVVLHPILPAKGGGMVRLIFDLQQPDGTTRWHEFMAAPVYSEALQTWCEARARRLADLLGLPLSVESPSYDC